MRPMPLGELLDETFKLYRRHFYVFAGVALIVVIPNLLISLISGSYRANPVTYFTQVMQNLSNPSQLQVIQQRQSQAISPLYFLSFPIAFLLFPFTAGAPYRAATSFAAGNQETIGSVLMGTLRRYFAMFGIAILTGLVALGFIGIVTIPVVIWVLVRWTVDTPALFAEGIGPVAAIGRSWNLTRDNWWRTVGILLVVLIMVGIIEYALTALFAGIAAVIPGLNQDLQAGLVQTVTTVVNALVGVVSPIAITMLYLDLRVRKEGADLDQLARETAAPGPSPT
jgi:hypothetical protein